MGCLRLGGWDRSGTIDPDAKVTCLFVMAGLRLERCSGEAATASACLARTYAETEAEAHNQRLQKRWVQYFCYYSFVDVEGKLLSKRFSAWRFPSAIPLTNEYQ